MCAGSGLTKACSHLTAPVLVRPLLEEERVAGEEGRWEEVDLEFVLELSLFGRMFGLAVLREFKEFTLDFPSEDVLTLILGGLDSSPCMGLDSRFSPLPSSRDFVDCWNFLALIRLSLSPWVRTLPVRLFLAFSEVSLGLCVGILSCNTMVFSGMGGGVDSSTSVVFPLPSKVVAVLLLSSTSLVIRTLSSRLTSPFELSVSETAVSGLTSGWEIGRAHV